MFKEGWEDGRSLLLSEHDVEGEPKPLETTAELVLVNVPPQGNEELALEAVSVELVRNLTFAQSLGFSGTPAFMALQTPLAGAVGYDRLKEALEQIAHQYAWIIIDCPPSLNMLTLNALVAADSVLVPLQTEYYALEGLSALLATVKQIRDHRNPRLEMEGIVINQFNSQARLPGELVAELEEEGYQVFDTYLNTSVKMKESHRDHRPLIDLAPSHKLTAQFLDLHAELEKTLSRAAA